MTQTKTQYTVSVESYQVTSRPNGWLVTLQYETGTKFARRYHYKKDAMACAVQAREDLSDAPQFYPYDQVVKR